MSNDRWDPEAAKIVRGMLKMVKEGNTRGLNQLAEAMASQDGLKDILPPVKTPVENPQENWEKLLYTPTSFKTKKDKDGNPLPLSDEDKRKQMWRSIQGRNVGGDLAMGAGAVTSALANTMAAQAEGAAKASATDAQRKLYGSTTEDRAAAALSPFQRNMAKVDQALWSIIANRLYQSAAERRAAYLQSLMDSEYNNMGMPGQYADARRHAADVIQNSTPNIGGQ